MISNYYKAIRVIASCENVTQLEGARRFINQFLETEKSGNPIKDRVTWERYKNLSDYYVHRYRKLCVA